MLLLPGLEIPGRGAQGAFLPSFSRPLETHRDGLWPILCHKQPRPGKAPATHVPAIRFHMACAHSPCPL